MTKIDKPDSKDQLSVKSSTLYQSYRYSKMKKSWEFLGWRCTHCNIIFKRANTVPQHPDNCLIRKRDLKKLEDQPSKIVTVDGREWKTVDINQKYSDPDTSNFKIINIE